jgi:hypothetical protein
MATPIPSDLELEIVKALSKQEESRVRQVLIAEAWKKKPEEGTP